MKRTLKENLKIKIGSLDADLIITSLEKMGINDFKVSSQGITFPPEWIGDKGLLEDILNGFSEKSTSGRVLKITEKEGVFSINTKTFTQLARDESYLFRNKSKRALKGHSGINSEIARGIDQGAAGVTIPKSKQPIIGSLGASECVIAAVYNPETKTAALAHIDANSSPYQAMKLLKSLVNKNEEESPLEVTLATDVQSGNQTLKQLKELIKEDCNMRLITVKSARSLAIDTRSNEIFTGITASQLYFDANSDKRMECRGMSAQLLSLRQENYLPISVVFDGREDILGEDHHKSSENTMGPGLFNKTTQSDAQQNQDKQPDDTGLSLRDPHEISPY